MIIRKILLLAASFAAVAAYGNTTWNPNPAKNLGDSSSNGNAALTDMSYWTNGNGVVGSGAPTATDDLVLDKTETGQKKNRLRFNTGNFTGNSLQVGTASQSATVVHDGGTFTCTNEGLKFKSGNWWFNAGPGASFAIKSDVTVLANNPSFPFVMHVGQEQYSNGTARLEKKLKGAADAELRLGYFSGRSYGDTGSTTLCAKNSTFDLYDISEYAGKITVLSTHPNEMNADWTRGYGALLRLRTGSTTSPAKIRLAQGSALNLLGATVGGFGYEVTVKELSLSRASRLCLNASTDAVIANNTFWHVRAKDALTIEPGEGQVELYWRPIVRGNKYHRFPILTGPASSTFTADDFKITVMPNVTLYNLDLHLEVDDGPEAGECSLYAVTRGFIYQTSAYRFTNEVGTVTYYEGSRDGQLGAASSLTNAAAWWGGLAPHATNSAALYRTTQNLRTLYAPNEPYAFPCGGFYLNGGTLIIQTKTFEVPELWWSHGTIGSGQGHAGVRVVDLIAPKIHLRKNAYDLTLRSYENCLFSVKGEIDGAADIKMRGWGGTGAPKVNFVLDGPNTNFTGSLIVQTDEVRPEYHNFNSLFPTLYVYDGRNLGGAKATFDPRALTLTTLARLAVTNDANVTLAAGLNRGLYIKHTGRFHTPTAASTLDVKWPLLLSGKMWKEGAGTLVLGDGLKHEASDGGALTDIPRAGSNLFEIVAGTVKIAHADALSGVETTIKAGASLKLAIDPANADLTAYGIRNTTVDTPFTLDASFGGKLPLTLDTAGVASPDSRMITNALVTVKSTSAAAVGAMLSAVKPWRNYGYASTVVSRANADDTTTLLLVSKFKGMTFYLR